MPQKLTQLLLEAKIPAPSDVQDWPSWEGNIPSKYRIWKGIESPRPKPNMEKISKLKYLYHGTSLEAATKMLKTGVRSSGGEFGLNVTADINYAMSFSGMAVADNPNLVAAIVAIPVAAVDWKKATMSDNYDDTMNAQIHNAIPGSSLKIVAVGTSTQKLEKLKRKKLQEQNDIAGVQTLLNFLLTEYKPSSVNQAFKQEDDI